MQTCSLQTVQLDDIPETNVSVPSGLKITANMKRVLVTLIKCLQKEELSENPKQEILKVQSQQFHLISYLF
jgi:hypothetical protein